MKLIISIVLAIGLQNASSYMLNRLPIGNHVFGRDILQKITTNSLPENHWRNGFTIDHKVVYGEQYYSSSTAPHVAGHYLCLYHTFQTDCSAPDDAVDDSKCI